MTKNLRAVFDTNVFVAAALSRNHRSPTRELIERWGRGEFTLLICEAIADEIVEKLSEHNLSPKVISQLMTLLEKIGEWVEVPASAVPHVLADLDDEIVLACAVVGQAQYLVTYDPDFNSLGGHYQGVKIVKALPFLWAVRGDTPPLDSP